MGLNPRALGINPRALKVNPRSLGTNPRDFHKLLELNIEILKITKG